jgi:hypothetical protein
MPYAGNFHPEWGYFAPAPGLVRTVRIILVAAVVGATAAATVVLAFVAPRPDIDETYIAARTLVRPAESSTMRVRTSEGAQINTPATIQKESATPSAAAVQAGAAAPSESKAAFAVQSGANITAVAEVPATTDATSTTSATIAEVSGSKKTPAAAVALVQKKASKTRHVASHYASQGWPIVRPRGEYDSNASWGRPYPEGRWAGYAADGDYSYR